MPSALRSLFAVGGLIGGLCVGGATSQAASGEQTERLVYVMQFGGLRIADVLITLTETPEHYQTTVKLRPEGILTLFKHFRADLAGEGAIADAGLKVEPEVFRRGWSMDTLSSTLEISYDPDNRVATAEERLVNPVTGELKNHEDEPWNRRQAKIKPVPAELRTGVLDPLAAFIAAREMLRANQSPRSFRVPVFDGLRRYDLISSVEAARDITINNDTRRLIAVKSRLEPVFGFDPNLQDRMHEGEGTILFTADDRALPVQIMIGNSLGVGVMNLVTDCKVDPAPCEAFADNQQAQAPRN